MGLTIRVAIANDTVIALEALRRAIATDPAYRLIWTASDGALAVEKALADPPDLMLMDLLMPKVDGVEATRQIMARSPCAILIVTASVHRNTSRVFEAMGAGALDVVKTPALGQTFDGENLAAARPLLDKMATMSVYLGKARRWDMTGQKPAKSAAPLPQIPELIVIGASTGGPKAVAKILSQLPAERDAAVVVVQHIDAQFSTGLAEWLDGQTAMAVRLAKTGDRPKAGTVLVAKGDRHLVMESDRTLSYTSAFSNVIYRPSVDVFFASVAQHWPLLHGAMGKAILLTGMGRDGAKGLSALRAARWETIAESEESCVVYGMPRAAIALGAACQILSIQEISDALIATGR